VEHLGAIVHLCNYKITNTTTNTSTTLNGGGVMSKGQSHSGHPEARNQTAPAARSVEDLEVFQLAHALVLRIYELTRSFPADERFGLTAQIRRAAASVPANLAERAGRLNRAEGASSPIGARLLDGGCVES
jgi:hypothetical protein